MLAILVQSEVLKAQTTYVRDGFDHGLANWEVRGSRAAAVVDSHDSAHGMVLELRPNVWDGYVGAAR